jgi:hypothetical protein
MERLARQFARELRMAAWHAQAVSEEALGDLRVILDETLDRIKAEVFAATARPRRPTDSTGGPAAGTGPAPDSGPAGGTGPEPGSGPAAGTGAAPDSGPRRGTGPAPDAGGADTS